jgi:hypothetical protein
MLQETASIDPKAASFSDAASIRTHQQNSKQESNSISSSTNASPGRLPPANPREKISSTPSKKPKKKENSPSGISEAESETERPGQVDQEDAAVQTSTELRRISALSAVSKTHTPPSHHDRATLKLVSHQIDPDKKIRKQIRIIQKAIKQESSRKPSKANSGILKGLKKTLDKLTATRTRLDQSPLSQSQNSQNRSSSPEKESRVENQLCQGAIQKVTPPTPQQSPAGIEEIQPHSDLPTVEEPSSILLGTVSVQLLAEAKPTQVSVLTLQSERTMAECTSSNGKKSPEKRDLASADHDMTDAETNTDTFFPLTEECHHYTRRSDVDWDIQK